MLTPLIGAKVVYKVTKLHPVESRRFDDHTLVSLLGALLAGTLLANLTLAGARARIERHQIYIRHNRWWFLCIRGSNLMTLF